MNPLDIALQEAINTIAQLQARIFNLAVENAGLRASILEIKKNAEKDATSTAGK